MADIKIGTSGYSYTEWVGVVYPAGMKQYEFLGHYAGLFPTVELNFSYYKMPEAKNLAKMLVDSGETLTFSICKPHSASYAMVSFQSAYLCVHHPAEFIAAVLSNRILPPTRIAEARLFTLGPDINLSHWKYYGKGREVVDPVLSG